MPLLKYIVFNRNDLQLGLGYSVPGGKKWCCSSFFLLTVWEHKYTINNICNKKRKHVVTLKLYSLFKMFSRQKLTVCPIIDGEEHLRLLNFQHNFITRIQNISNLQRLIFLDLYDNQIEEISGLSTLRSLRVLLLGKNR